MSTRRTFGGDDLQVEFINHQATNRPENSNRFTFTISAEGQPLEIDGEEVKSVTFTVTGDWELNDLLWAMDEIRKRAWEGVS
jgi:hypothetical protein